MVFIYAMRQVMKYGSGVKLEVVLVPAGTSKSTSRRHGIQAVTRVMAYVADAVTL
jgi:hypothetical protein